MRLATISTKLQNEDLLFCQQNSNNRFVFRLKSNNKSCFRINWKVLGHNKVVRLLKQIIWNRIVSEAMRLNCNILNSLQHNLLISVCMFINYKFILHSNWILVKQLVAKDIRIILDSLKNKYLSEEHDAEKEILNHELDKLHLKFTEEANYTISQFEVPMRSC